VLNGALVLPNVIFECVSPSICGLPTWFIGETCHEGAEIVCIGIENRAAATVYSLWCTSLITVIKARCSEHCVFMKLNCPCCDPSLFGLSCNSLYTSRSDCNFIIRYCRFIVWMDFSIDQDLYMADRHQLSWILETQRGVWMSQSVSAWFQNRGV